MQLEFKNFSLSYNWGYHLEIYDGRDSSAPLLVKVYRRNHKQKILASGNEVFIRYKMYSCQANRREYLGFKLRYSGQGNVLNQLDIG